MNIETLQEAYNELMRNYIKAQNKLQDIGFALSLKGVGINKEECLNRIIEIWSRD